MKISFDKAFKLLLSADIVMVSNGDYRENVSICSAGNDDSYFTVLWESDEGEDYTYDVCKSDNPTLSKHKNKLTFITSDDSNSEALELFLFKKTPLE